MGTPKTLYNVTRTVPAVEEQGWSVDMSAYTSDLIDGVEGTSTKKGSIVVPCLPPKAPETYAAGGTITPTHPEHVISGTPGAVTLTPFVAIGNGSKVGERLRLKGGHATNTVTILDAANTVMNGLVTLGLNESILFEWDGNDWIELSRST